MAEEKKGDQAPKHEKKVEHRGKKVRKGRKHSSLQASKAYDVKSGALTRKRKQCPRCGMGTWLAGHKGRLYCGRCHYTFFEKKQV
jgi:ubiquitin-small subunit ribosomal protein S27Ae